jgi:hypothetical protein
MVDRIMKRHAGDRTGMVFLHTPKECGQVIETALHISEPCEVNIAGYNCKIPEKNQYLDIG